MKSIIKSNGALEKTIGIESNRIVEKGVEKNFRLVPVALHRMGFGEKRIRAFTDIYNEVMAEYKIYDKEGIFTEKLKKEYSFFNCDPDEFISIHIPYKERQRREKQKYKPVSVVEAAKMQKQLSAMKKILEQEVQKSDILRK